ncbi:hypothetical protein BCEP4_2310004 [Burkholderia cepacia]|nr:hypothetical protein BCEP4_2310004 [Burkholderia cepacia]
MHADKGYDFVRFQRYLRQPAIEVRLARRNEESIERLG